MVTIDRARRPDIRRRHYNLWLAVWTAVFVHFWIAASLLQPFPARDLLDNSYLFRVVPPPVWAAFSIATGLGMIWGLIIGPYIVQQVSAGWGVIMAAALSLNGLAASIKTYAEGGTPTLGVRLIFGLGLFYTIGHFMFATEPPENPATTKGGEK